MLSAKQGNFGYHFYNVWYTAVLDPGPSALKLSKPAREPSKIRKKITH